MDLSVNRTFKRNVAIKWKNYITSLTGKDVSKSGYYQSPGREQKVLCASYAWKGISKEVVFNGFSIYKRALESQEDISAALNNETDNLRAVSSQPKIG